MKRFILVLSVTIGLLLPINFPAKADSLTVAQDHLFGYNRALFKLWIDEDKDGCNTRAEVLIEEAIVKPKVGKKCAFTGGKWLSPYDEKTTTQANDLDIDHLVPLAEAWRSGAWAWTPAQRQVYANDLTDSRALVAVSLGLNRAKGDKDVASWLPPKGVCVYIENWIAIKVKYSLTADTKEITVLNQFVTMCGLAELNPAPAPTPAVSPFPSPSVSATPTPTATKSPSAPSKFNMPFIFGTYGEVVSNWGTYGFKNQPIWVQEKSPISTYGCKPISNSDYIYTSLQSPKSGEMVNEDTQVVLTLFCMLDTNAKTTPTPTPTATTAPAPTPTTSSLAPTATPVPVPTPTPSSTPANPSLVKYANCTAAKAAGVTPILRSTNPDLYALNSGLDRDKDGVACES